MKSSVNSVVFGAVVCKCCGQFIEAVNTEKVTTYYSNCKQEQCDSQKSQKR
ncbi:GapA-binding peptide SR1P [Priestia megaterium]|uniref:GapA-binding peptide SR1P n=1 Tax=Priestia megaterium TaxID=1404 RepID=UPI00387A243C